MELGSKLGDFWVNSCVFISCCGLGKYGYFGYWSEFYYLVVGVGISCIWGNIRLVKVSFLKISKVLFLSYVWVFEYIFIYFCVVFVFLEVCRYFVNSGSKINNKFF